MRVGEGDEGVEAVESVHGDEADASPTLNGRPPAFSLAQAELDTITTEKGEAP